MDAPSCGCEPDSSHFTYAPPSIATTPLTTRAPRSISPPHTSTLDVICWLRMIAEKTRALAGYKSATMLASRALTYAIDATGVSARIASSLEVPDEYRADASCPAELRKIW